MCIRTDARELDLGYFVSGYTSTDDCQQHIQLELNLALIWVRAANRIHIKQIKRLNVGKEILKLGIENK